MMKQLVLYLTTDSTNYGNIASGNSSGLHTSEERGKGMTQKKNRMKCYLFNDPFNNYGHIGSGNGSRYHKYGGGLGMKRWRMTHSLRLARNP